MIAEPRTGFWLTAREVAEEMEVHVNTVKRIPPPELPYFSFGHRGDRRYRASDVAAYMNRRITR